jgi:acetyl-CoA synthetase
VLRYEECAAVFSWPEAPTLLDGLPGGRFDIAHEAIDCHVLAGRGDKLAVRWIGRDDRTRDLSLRGAKGAWQSVANVFGATRYRQGRDRVFASLGRVLESRRGKQLPVAPAWKNRGKEVNRFFNL